MKWNEENQENNQFDIKGIDDKLRTDYWESVTLTKELTIGWTETVLILLTHTLILVPLWLQNHAFLFKLYQTFDCSKFKNYNPRLTCWHRKVSYNM